MRLLLDTHALIWWLEESARLSVPARSAIADGDNEIHVSAASGWEIANKVRIGKLPSVAEMAPFLDREVDREGFLPLSVTFAHGMLAGSLEGAHKDPFDRMLIAQALAEDLVLVSNETVFDGCGVTRIW